MFIIIYVLKGRRHCHKKCNFGSFKAPNLLSIAIIGIRRSYLLVERRCRIEFLTDKRSHGNVRNFKTLGEPLGEDVPPSSRGAHEHPLHSSIRPRSIQTKSRLRERAIVSVQVLVIGVVVKLQGGRWSKRSTRGYEPCYRRNSSHAAQPCHGEGAAADSERREREEEEEWPQSLKRGFLWMGRGLWDSCHSLSLYLNCPFFTHETTELPLSSFYDVSRSYLLFVPSPLCLLEWTTLGHV